MRYSLKQCFIPKGKKTALRFPPRETSIAFDEADKTSLLELAITAVFNMAEHYHFQLSRDAIREHFKVDSVQYQIENSIQFESDFPGPVENPTKLEFTTFDRLGSWTYIVVAVR